MIETLFINHEATISQEEPHQSLSSVILTIDWWRDPACTALLTILRMGVVSTTKLF